jgi:transposase
VSSMPHSEDRPGLVVGVDTHRDCHVAVAVNHLGARLGSLSVPATAAGYRQLIDWVTSQGRVLAFGVEGTGSYGAGLSRALQAAGYRVIEVNRPDRSTRRRLGKSDPIDAEAAARAVLAGTATTTPKTGTGTVEMIRMLKRVKDSATKARTQAINQLKAVLVTAPPELREALTGLPQTSLLSRCAAPPVTGPLETPTQAAERSLQLLARRAQTLGEEIQALREHLDQLTTHAAAPLRDTFAVGPDTAATLLATAGDNPTRLRSEAAFAALCGASPIPASSGRTVRHRLNRGGDRHANAALHQIAVVRLRWHPPTRAYMTRRLTEGKTKAEIMRCLKRYIAREIYRTLCPHTT